MGLSNLAGVTSAVRRGLSSVGELLLPAGCLACDGPGPIERGLCGPCSLRLLELAALPYCPRCGRTLGPGLPLRDDGCGDCPTPLPPFGRLVRVGPYAPPLRGMIRKLKYAGQPAGANHLAPLLAGRVSALLAEEDEPPEAVIALPSHWLRRLARGIDHPALLAGALARRLDLPEAVGLVRRRNTPPQARLSRRARVNNVRGAFDITSDREIAGAHLLLVDDVTTTGATAAEAARTLRAAGARRVTLVVAAKSERLFSYLAHLRASVEATPHAGQPPSSSSASTSS